MNDPLIGRQLANFRVERMIGRGGMASVYYGRDVKLARPVAIKVIDASFRGNPSFARRFVQEAQTVATWRHENVVQIYYADNDGDLYYFVMEFIDGLDLAGLLNRYMADGELMPHRDVVRIGRAIASALDYAHTKGVIHRDVKPNNVMIATDDRVVLMDFGLALDASQGTLGEVFGTPHYIAPEQARSSADAIPQSDLYALGVMLYEMLTGTVPFDDPSPTAIALQHLTQPLPSPRERNPRLNAETEAVLQKALSKSAADRYSKGYELMDALDTALQTPPLNPLPMHGEGDGGGVELPPLPAGVEPRSVSSVTVAEKIAQYTQQKPTAVSYPEPALPPTKRHLATEEIAQPAIAAPAILPPPPRDTSNRNVMLIGLAAFMMMAIAGLAVAALLLSGGDDPGVTATPDEVAAIITEEVTQEVAAVATATETEIVVTEALVQSTATEGGIEFKATFSPQPDTETPTNTAEPPTAAPTNTDAPTNTPQPTNTDVPTTAPTNTEAPPAIAAEPTILYPEGQHFTLYYNDNSFYIHNASSKMQYVRDWGFERINTDGSFTNAFTGAQMIRYYQQIDSTACARMELLQRTSDQFLRPGACRFYNISMTPQADDSFVFWTASPNSSQFRVTWAGAEIARCEIAAGQCEVYLP